MLGLSAVAVATDVAAAAETPAARAARLVAAMTFDEKIDLAHSRFGMPLRGKPAPAGALDSAGYVPGLPRLGLPPLQESDAGLGVANPTNAPFDATAMPNGLALAASFDPALAERAGTAIGAEARDKGFSVLLAGGANLTRDSRGGRDFEYAGEDPMLTGAIVGAEIAGIERKAIVSTLKHFALNAQENGRVVLDARLGEAAARESDLLAFELALERGRPGAVMTSYNRVDGTFASQNAHLVGDILKRDWGFDGWVMSDWGGTHATEAAANAGLDQESGVELDDETFFGAPLAAAVRAGRVPMARLDDMVARQLRTRIAAGLLEDPPRPGGVRDLDAHASIAEEVAARGIVLLKNALLETKPALPLEQALRRVLVVGGHADRGVLSGGGSSQVVPAGSIRYPGQPAADFYGKPRLYDPSPPLAALREAMPGTRVDVLDGDDTAAAARAAQAAEAVVVFVDAWRNESRDAPDLALPAGQDALVVALATANARTIVVLETGGPVTMPWRDAVAGIVEAWYPGERGRRGDRRGAFGPNRSRRPPADDVSRGRVAAAAPARYRPGDDDLEPRRADQGYARFAVDYDIEGPDVGYKWFLRTGRTPLYPFGFGLSYTRFATSAPALSESGGGRRLGLEVGFDLRNTGTRAGTEVAQVYVDGPGFTRRLAGFATAALKPSATRHVSVAIDPRLLAHWDVAANGWRIAAGRYTLAVRPDALADGPGTQIDLRAFAWPGRHGACGGTPCPDRPTRSSRSSRRRAWSARRY